MTTRTTSLLLFLSTFAFGCGSSSSGADAATTGAGGSTSAGGSGGSGTAGSGTAGGGAAGASAGAAGMATAGAAGAAGKGAGGAAGAAGAAAGGAAGKGAGGAAGADNDSFDTAATIMYDDGSGTNAAMTTIDPPTTDVDFYKFTGKKGDALHLYTQCKPHTNPYEPTFPDLVMTLYNEQKQQIANDDDSTQSNDPELFTVLPADGTYYVRIQECNAWDKGGPANCSPAAAIVNKDYVLAIQVVDPTAAGNVLETEPNDTAAAATKLKYAPVAGQAGAYYLTVAYGGFSSATDVDMYSFKIPADTKLQQGRAVGYFSWYPSGVDGSGSTTQFGEAAIVDPSDVDATHAVARIPDGSKSTELSPPLTLGKDYLLALKRGAKMGANDFYFVLHFAQGSNPLETEQAAGANDTIATAEVAISQDNSDGSQTFFIEGDISTPADVDVFSAALTTAGLNTVTGVCGAEGSGSGLRQMKLEVLAADGTAIPGATATDSFDKGASLTDVALPAGTTKALVRISAPMVDATITSTFYRCGITFLKK